MEAVPRLPMLSFDLRQSAEPVDFGSKLKQFIRSHYNEDPEMFGNEISQLEGLRSSAVRPTRDVTGCSTLKRYYCQLHFLSSRFPMSRDGEAAVRFSWKHLSNNSTSSSADITLEMTSILYNIGALHSQLGAGDNRTTAHGMKMSCTHFQCAAWAYQHICDEYANSSGLDLSLDLMSFMTKLCLAQAQECILEKSMMDNRKSSIIAKVSVQTVDYYRQALKIISDASDESGLVDLVGSKLCKKWEKYLRFKVSYHWSVALLFQGQQSEEQHKMGERVAFYQASFEKLDEARKLSKGLDNMEAVNEVLTFVHDVVEGKRKAAKNENEFIYHEDIPDISLLPDVKGASLVKGIPFNINDIEVSGPDIFSRIVPMEAHQSSSLYSEEKAKLLRRVVAMIENKDEELETFLSTLQLDELNKAEGNQLPQELIDRCAALSAKPDAVKNLLDSMNSLSSIYLDVEAMLTEIRELLNEEEMREREYQENLGKRPPSIVATDLTREAKKYQEAQSKASESNQTLHKAMVLHVGNMKLLSLPPKELITHIPQIVESEEVEANSKEMRHLMDKVNEMKQQRLLLSERLRESIYQDDILRQIVTYAGDDIQQLFDSELQKHQRTVSLIEQNLAAQENILRAVKDAYARFGTTRKSTSEMCRRREAVVASLISSYDAYEDLLAKSSKGLDFYKKLEVNVSKLLQRVRGTCKVQDEERDQLLKNATKSSEKQEVNSTNRLKLKDYLDMKKEFGKLSLDNPPVPQSNPCYSSDAVANPNWIPGVRPAPVGSEGTEANAMNRMDSYAGYYQSQGGEDAWGNSNYPADQTVDDRMKYYAQVSAASENPRTYPSESNAQSGPRDVYPISAYSSVMQNTSDTGYAGPKSNYYSTLNSPSRYVNPPHFYSDYSQPVVGSYGPAAAVVTSQAPAKNSMENITQSQLNPYATPIATGYSYPSSAPVPSAASFAVGQSDVSFGKYPGSDQTNDRYPVASASGKNHAAESFPSQVQYGSYPMAPYATPQNPALAPLPQGYAPYSNNYVVPDSNVPSESAPGGYGAPVNCSGAAQCQPSVANLPAYETNQISGDLYQQSTAGAAAYVDHTMQSACYGMETVSNPTTVYSAYNIPGANMSGALPQSYGNREMSKLPDGYPYNGFPGSGYQEPANLQTSNFSPASWQQAYGPSASLPASFPNGPNHHMQTGNDSVYTACQTNNYAVTNSDAYRSSDGQSCDYPGQGSSYPNQYYINQYGACNGQYDCGTGSGNAVTYMQAHTERHETTTTTYSGSDTKPSPSTEHSNVDLLAGLDFTVNQPPLVPETTALPPPQADPPSEAPEKLDGKCAPHASDLALDSRDSKPENPSPKDSFSDVERLNQFGQDVEKYEKFVESLTIKTLNGPTCLDLKWKEILELQDKSNHLHIISVARCYPMKNRFPDILPYDDSRVELPSTKDDYINASLMKGLTPLTPSFILTQAPLPSTYGDFWAMVFEQQVEVIVCLLGDPELAGHVYWPSEKGQEQEMGKLKINLQSCNVKPHWIERIMSVTASESRVTRVVSHLQLTSWPGSSFPESPGPFLSFATECINFFSQQRSANHPAVVHCTSGVGRTGLFCLIVAAVMDVQSGKGIPDLVAVTGRMSQYRKSCLRDREHLKFAYQAVLYYSQDLLMKRGILTNRSAFDDKKLKEGKCHTRHPSEDFLLGPPTDVSQLQSGMEKLGFECPGKKNEAEARSSRSCRSQSACSRRDSTTNSCTSSGRSSPASLPPDVLATLDPANFTLKLDSSKGKANAKKRYTTESFAKKSEPSLDAFNSESDDPLSRLDPLWTMKK